MRLVPASYVGHPSRIFISAGEVSGDIAGSHLAEALLRVNPGVRLSGVGGERMRRAGVEVLFDTNHLRSVGLSESLSTLPGLKRTVSEIRSHLSRSRPDVAVLIGHEVFHMFLARWLRTKGIPIVSYFPPQVWLWGKVARWIAPGFDRILTSFLEEHDVYHGVVGRAIFVGHYLRDVIGSADSERRQDIRRNLQLGARIGWWVCSLGAGCKRSSHCCPFFWMSLRSCSGATGRFDLSCLSLMSFSKPKSGRL